MKVLVLAIAFPQVAAADPIRLRADALATTSAPAGLVTVEADGNAGPNVSAEAVVWTGAGTIGDTAHADVLVVALRARTADGRFGVRVGRFVESLGALRPVQVDGAAGRVRLPFAFEVEAYAGMPVMLVVPADGSQTEPFTSVTTARAWDWVAGGRVSRRT